MKRACPSRRTRRRAARVVRRDRAGPTRRADFHILDNKLFVYADGPGFNVLMTKYGIHTHIDDASFGIPSAGFPIQRATDSDPVDALRPFVCDGGTYHIVVRRSSSPRRSALEHHAATPPPYPPAFNTGFPEIITFVGTIEGPSSPDQSGEQFKLYMTDLAHEVINPRSFSSTTRSTPTSSTRAGACATMPRSSGA